MKKILIICLLLAFAFGAVAETVGMPNPVTEYETLSEINEIVGCELAHPAVMGVTDERFSVIETESCLIAEYCFDLNGLEYTFRCGAVADEDISGVYIDGESAFGSPEGNDIEYAFGEGFKLARWFDINGQYILIQDDQENVMDEETFRLIAEEMKDLTSTVPTESELEAFYESLEGIYDDSFSQRATAEVTANGSEGALIKVFWAESATVMYNWTMNVKLMEDGLLCYKDGSLVIVTIEGETDTAEVQYENAEGFFSYDGEALYWNGAEDESCTDCVFVKN